MATVDQIQSTSATYTADIIRQGTQFVNALAGFTGESIAAIPFPDVPAYLISNVLAENAVGDVLARRPLLSGVVQDTIFSPDAPDISGNYSVPDILNIPELTATAPTLAFPERPDADVPGAPGGAPEFIAPANAVRPTFSLPTTPSFSPVAVPEAVALNMPTFTSVEPVDTVTAPTYTFTYAEAEYESAMLDELRAKLTEDLINGGYGIDTEDERRLWDRARDREMIAASVVIENLAREAAARGFTLPPGQLWGQMQAARQDMAAKISGLERDIAIKKADLYVENRKFTIEQVRALEQILMDFFSARSERALNAAKATVEMGIAVYNAQVAKFNLRLEVYRTAAQVYETKIRAALGNLEAYKTQVEAASLGVEVQRNMAELYKAQLAGVEALMGVYRTDVDVTKVKAEIERIKLEGFKARVDTYVAQVQAKAAEFDMYSAGVKGEQARVEAYRSSVEAYSSQVEAYRSRAQTQEIVSRVQIAQDEALLRKYSTEIQKYAADIQRETSRVNSLVSNNSQYVSMYNAEAGAIVKTLDSALEGQKANSYVLMEQARSTTQQMLAQAQVLLKNLDMRKDAAKTGAEVLINLGGAVATQLSGIAVKTE